MKREFAVMGVSAFVLFAVCACCPCNKFTSAIVLVCEAGVFWAFVSAFRKG